LGSVQMPHAGQMSVQNQNQQQQHEQDYGHDRMTSASASAIPNYPTSAAQLPFNAPTIPGIDPQRMNETLRWVLATQRGNVSSGDHSGAGGSTSNFGPNAQQQPQASLQGLHQQIDRNIPNALLPSSALPIDPSSSLGILPEAPPPSGRQNLPPSNLGSVQLRQTNQMPVQQQQQQQDYGHDKTTSASASAIPNYPSSAAQLPFNAPTIPGIDPERMNETLRWVLATQRGTASSGDHGGSGGSTPQQPQVSLQPQHQQIVMPSALLPSSTSHIDLSSPQGILPEAPPPSGSNERPPVQESETMRFYGEGPLPSDHDIDDVFSSTSSSSKS
jgi:hypothetical protein